MWDFKIFRSLHSLKDIWKDPGNKALRNIFWFFGITLLIHFSYRLWAHHFQYYPLQSQMEFFRGFLARMVLNQVTWIDMHILGLSVVKEGNLMRFDNGATIWISGDCSGDKQILQLALLLLLFPGRWIRKIWWIPAGVIIVNVTNIVRIALLSLVAVWHPEWMIRVHDTLIRALFYVVIFGIWWLFVTEGCIFRTRSPLPRNGA